MSEHNLIQVKSSKDLNRWLDFTNQLYTGGLFIPPARQNIYNLFHNKTPYQKSDMDVKFFLVEDKNHRVVARTTLHRSLKFNQKMSSSIQLFGFTEFVNDFEVFQFLFSELKKISKADKHKMLLGPANLLPNQFGGVITSGFAQRSFVDNVYNHPYYPKFYADFGFEKTFDSQTFICEDLNSPNLDPVKLFPFDENRINQEKLEIHCGQRATFRKSQIPILQSMLNESFNTLKYYTNISAEELLYQTDGLQFIMDNELFVYLTKDNKPIGFILCIPDLSEFMRSINGNLSAVNLVHLLITKASYKKDAILIIKGVIPSEMGKGYMGLLNRELLKNFRKLGYRTLRTTWVEMDNKASAAHFLRMNGKVLHDVSFYRMAV